MKVFVSSVVRGFEDEREAAATAAATLGNEVRRSEDFASSAASPQAACLAGVRWSDAVVLLLGGRYGARQASGLSATHEEYREAKSGRSVLAFVQDGVPREPPQEEFIHEVQDWQGGVLTGSFSTLEELSAVVLRALHELDLAKAVGPLDESEMLERGRALAVQDVSHQGAGPLLSVSTVFGPRRQVLRPSQLEDETLTRDLHQAALLGPHAVFDTSEGVRPQLEGSSLLLAQPGATLAVDETGSVAIRAPAADRGRYPGLPVLIEEDVRERLTRSFRLTGVIVDRLDPAHRLTHALSVVTLTHASGYGWRTREEHLLSPNQMQVSARAGDQVLVELAPPIRPRASLTHDAPDMAEDIIVLLRREHR